MLFQKLILKLILNFYRIKNSFKIKKKFCAIKKFLRHCFNIYKNSFASLKNFNFHLEKFSITNAISIFLKIPALSPLSFPQNFSAPMKYLNDFPQRGYRAA